MIKKAVGIFQLITGLFGIVILILNAIVLGSDIYNQQIFMLQLFLGVFLYGSLAWAGYSLYYNYQKAFKMSLSIQFIQIPAFAIKGLMYKFSASAFIFTGLNNSSFFFKTTLKPIDFALTANPEHNQLYGIYLFPLLLFIILLRIKNN